MLEAILRETERSEGLFWESFTVCFSARETDDVIGKFAW